MKSLDGLFIKNFNSRSIRVNCDVVNETKNLPPETIPNVINLPKHGWIKIGHVRSFIAKQEDVIRDEAITNVNIMCFTETFFHSHQIIERGYVPVQGGVVFRLDRLQTTSESLARGGIMIVCLPSLKPVRLTIGHHPSELEVLGIKITPNHDCIYSMCVVAVYRRPQQQLPTFLSLLSCYMSSLPSGMPTVILGDFMKISYQSPALQDCSTSCQPEVFPSLLKCLPQTMGHYSTTYTIITVVQVHLWMWLTPTTQTTMLHTCHSQDLIAQVCNREHVHNTVHKFQKKKTCIVQNKYKSHCLSSPSWTGVQILVSKIKR